MPKVTWKRVPGYRDYVISSHGEIRRTMARGVAKDRPIKPYKTKAGYSRVCLFEDDKKANHFVHRLMALAFLGPPPTPAHQAAHNDGERSRNVLENIRWATPQENIADRAVHGREARGERAGGAKLTEAAARRIKFGNEVGADLAREFGVSQTLISMVRHGRWWKHVTEAL